MNEKKFRMYLKKRGINDEKIDSSVEAVREFENFLHSEHATFESADTSLLEKYLQLLIKKGRNSFDTLVAVARYCYIMGKNEFYIHFAAALGARNVLPDIGERLATIAGEDARKKVFKGFELPPLGSPPTLYPLLTRTIISRMEAELPPETCRKILTWNYHNIPAESFKEKKERFEKASSVDEFLREEHRRLVEELKKHLDEGRIWFEQEITPEVVEYVKSNQEICTGVRRGSKIYVTKIPYAPSQFLKEQNPTLKRYYACHCPLAREAIRSEDPGVSPTLCYCSAGFEKLAFDVVFGEPAEVELLESALNKDTRCRFAVTIPADKMK